MNRHFMNHVGISPGVYAKAVGPQMKPGAQKLSYSLECGESELMRVRRRTRG
jgi:hypothetical protein